MPEEPIYYRVCVVNDEDEKETVYLGTDWLESREHWLKTLHYHKAWIDLEDKDGNPHPCLELVRRKTCESS